MALAHIVVLSAALVAPFCLLCVVFVLLRDDKTVLRPSALTRSIRKRVRRLSQLRRLNQRGILDRPTGPGELLRRAARAGTMLRRASRGDNRLRHVAPPSRRAGRNTLGIPVPRPAVPPRSAVVAEPWAPPPGPVPAQPPVPASFPAAATPGRQPPFTRKIVGGKASMSNVNGTAARATSRDPHVQLDSGLRDADINALLAGLPSPTIEYLASELRRLDRRRRGATYGSERWMDGVLKAYDVRLCLACRCLGVAQRLEPLEGLDRELERVRMETELEAAGLTLH